MNQEPSSNQPDQFTAAITRALRRAAKTARKTAIFHGTPIYVCRAGKIVAIKPKKP